MNQIPRNELNLKNCIGFMPVFTYGDYLYLNDIDETQKSYNQISIHQNDPDMTIMNPIIILKKSFIHLPKFVFDQTLVPWIQ